MGDDNDGSAALVVQALEGLSQSGKRPQVDARFGFVEEHEAGVFGKNRRNLDALDLAAGQARVDVAAEIVARAQTDLRQIRTCLVMTEIFSRGNVQKVRHADALEARRLLKAVGDAASGAVGDGEVCYLLAVPENLTGGGRDQPHDCLCQRRLAAAVGSGDDDEFSVVDGKIDMLENVYGSALGGRGEAKIFQFEHNFSSFSQLSCQYSTVFSVSQRLTRRFGGFLREIR